MERLNRDTLFDSQNLSRDLAGKSVRGGMTTIAAQGVQFFLHLAGIMVLARLLTPNDYGLIGMVMVVVQFAAMFKDAGLSMATVQRDTISHEQISTLFWINVLISVLLGLCVLAGSPLIARFYGKSELTAVTAALSLSFLITGLTIQHQALLRRHMRFGTLASIHIASYTANLIVTICLALAGWRYWALVGGTLTTALSGTLLTFLFCPWIPGRMQKGTGARSMLKFGGHLTGFNFVNYFSRNADNVLIGKFIGADALGLYAKAYQLFMLPISQIRGPLLSVAMPMLSALKDQPQRYIKYYQHLLNVMISLMLPITLYSLVEAEFLIRTVLGSQWLAAVPVFRILALSALIQAIAGTRSVVPLSFGLSHRCFYFGLFNSIVCVGAFIAGLPFGIEGVATGYAVANYVVLPPSLAYAFHKTPVTIPLFLKTLTAPFLTGAMATGALLLMKRMNTLNSTGGHLVGLAVFVGVFVGISYCRKSVREMIGIVWSHVPSVSRRGIPVMRHAGLSGLRVEQR